MIRQMGGSVVAKISVICKNEKCRKEFVCETDGNDGEAFKSLGQMVIIERCPHCSYANRIVVPPSEGPKADLERFLEAVRIKNTLIDVEEIRAEFSEANGSYEEFFKIAGEGETDARLDQAAEYLKELISAVREGFRDNGSKLDNMSSSLKEISGKQDDLKKSITEGFRETGSSLKDVSGKQDQIIDRIDGAREEIVSEVSGMRSDLKGRTEERLQRIESDVTEIKARMRS